MWKCKNPQCKKTFPLAARISTERKREYPYTSIGTSREVRIIVEKPCCPFCESIEFEEVKDGEN